MKTLNKRSFIFFVLTWLLLFQTSEIFSQEFKYEIGGAAGTSFYLGDANKRKFYLNSGINVGVLFRYNLSLHWSLKSSLLAGNVSGDSKNEDNSFPFQQQTAFERKFAELGTQAEFNFLPYSDKFSYMGTKIYTPYIFAGAGLTYATGEKDFYGLNMPFGVGFKYKLKNRMNIGIEFSMRKLFRDDFDVTSGNNEWNLNNPYDINSSILKNQDWYSLTMIFLTWDFSSRDEPCR